MDGTDDGDDRGSERRGRRRHPAIEIDRREIIAKELSDAINRSLRANNQTELNSIIDKENALRDKLDAETRPRRKDDG